MQTKEFDFNGHRATVIIPDSPNGKWIWKTEFLYAFDGAERALLDRGYTRVYYSISDKYGSYGAVRLMHGFHRYLVEEAGLGLQRKCTLFGFSRGGLYAFNYALFYPELVERIYLDAPVLDMRSWPREGTVEREQVYGEFDLTAQTLTTFKGHPVCNLEEFFSLGIPLMLVAGDSDSVVPFAQNGEVLLKYAEKKGIAVRSIVKKGCDHHPHSLEDVTPIIDFVEGR